MAESLTDTNVAVFLAQRGTEEVEFTEPKGAVEDAGASTDVVGAETGEVQTVNNDLDPGDTFEVEKTFSEVSPDDYDALVVPGGSVGADQLRADGDAVDFVRELIEAEKPAGVICHGPWTLVEADVVEGRTLTSFPSLQTDIRNAGGEWVNKEVVVDEGLVTSRKPDDLDAFCNKIIEEFEEGRH
ncbi:intracellular protease, PfpI family protein [Halococcus morrhuae DSM 1307]|uniref:Intracellular protease, PfpI family protein n=2 Tax=Halococcus TaxID=2249 RepID=M0MF55_HALMO|nr:MULTISPECIES: type 1 glutamine amidotransferase domain-containing protein [Halococcus]EMA43025.1 intracellular protease, PfpI family protein [Halococcus morrhuae DSM 1307]UOO97485.1 type 1 glutamine amidotransferase [Halococcus dombrowskii]